VTRRERRDLRAAWQAARAELESWAEGQLNLDVLRTIGVARGWHPEQVINVAGSGPRNDYRRLVAEAVGGGADDPALELLRLALRAGLVEPGTRQELAARREVCRAAWRRYAGGRR
jgi:hypothetical protein